VIRATLAKRSVCFAGPLPPPMHGMAAVNADMVGKLRRHQTVHAYNLSPAATGGPLRRHGVKLARAAGAIGGIIASRLAGAHSFYGSVDDKIGGAITAVLVLVARLVGYRLFLHHHSFYYLHAPTRMMRFVAAAAGPRCVHILLCPEMEGRLRTLYPRAQRTTVAGNTVADPGEPGPMTERPELVLGMLSNLMFEKGIAEFVALLDACVEAGWRVRGILAGPAWTKEADAFVRAAVDRHAGRLEWLGPVSGAAKQRFFDRIDVFVFPTRYRTEAYPLVLLEALLQGRPIIAPARGCIRSLAVLQSATIVAPEDDFVAMVLPHLDQIAATPREELFRQARSDGEALNLANNRAQSGLIEQICGLPAAR
jgi:glycosyltransferase involved in cell wall biosynthesis